MTLLTGEQAAPAYSAYKDQYAQRHMKPFFQRHKSDPWFFERYDIQYAHSDIQQWTQEASERKEIFLSLLSSGSLSSFSLDSQDSVQIYEQLCTMSHRPALWIRYLPSHIRRSDIEPLFSSISGFYSLHISKPNPSRSFQRSCWVLFDPSVGPLDVLCTDHAHSWIVGNFSLPVQIQPRHENSRIKWTFSQDSPQSLQCAQSIVKWAEDNRYRHSLSQDSVISLITAASKNDERLELDLLILYLRFVHLFCFYCCTFANCQEELEKDCGYLHLRKSDHAQTTEPVQFNEKMFNHPPVISMARISQEQDKSVPLPELEKELERTMIVTEDPNVRCQLCGKLFKGKEFIFKHLNLKHDQDIIRAKDELFMTRVFSFYHDEWLPFLGSQASTVEKYTSSTTKRPAGDTRTRRPVFKRSVNRQSHAAPKQSMMATLRSGHVYSDLDAPRPLQTDALDYGNYD